MIKLKINILVYTSLSLILFDFSIKKIIASSSDVSILNSNVRAHDQNYYRTSPNSESYLSFIAKELNLQSNDLIFDVGANKGDMVDVFLRLGTNVVCFEPQPELINKLHKKFDANKHVTIEPLALGKEIGQAEMFICSEADTISSFSMDWIQNSRFARRSDQYYNWNKKITTPMTTLDKMIQKYGLPAFCKIDVEGYELEVISGLTYSIKFISFETHGEFFEKTINIIRYLVDMGYEKFNVSLGNNSEFLFKFWVSAKIFIEQLQKIIPLTNGKFWGDVYATY